MMVLKAEEMSCGHCTARITKALAEAGIRHEVCLEEKTVSIDGTGDVVARAIEILDDLGFSAVEV